MRKIFKFHFTTPVRFGPDNGGERLTSVRGSFHADTLFSALFIEALQSGQDEELLNAVNEGRLIFSDGLPFHENSLYLPRPIGILAPQKSEDNDPSVRKLFKKITYIPLEQMDSYLSGKSNPADLVREFGFVMEQTRVNTRDQDQPLPYRVMAYRFHPGCGLYVIAEYASEEELLLLRGLFASLAGTGFGGKVSSGWGKFDLSEEELPEKLTEYMDSKDADRFMLLNCALPADEELEEVLDQAAWALIGRGGYTGGSSTAVKKQEIHVFQAGSTFTKRFAGQVVNVGIHSPHPVWRCEKALMMGVKAN